MRKTGRIETAKGRMAILVGGGPAPGINGVISGAGIEAMDNEFEVIGLYDGFKSICDHENIDLFDETGPARLLAYSDLTRIHWEGGTILRTSRRRPSDDELDRAVKNLKDLGIDLLLTIGGDDTLTSSRRIRDAADGTIGVAHVPKTIDNDLPLAANTPTFGFETARHVGTEIVNSLSYDAKATNRWVFVIMMGRSAGHLALHVAKGAGATCCIIPEEFSEDADLTLGDVADTLISSMLVRATPPRGRLDGVAVIAEGVIGRLCDASLEEMKEDGLATIGFDDHSQLKFADILLGRALQLKVQDRLDNFTFNGGPKLTDGIVVKNIGYELRCHHPIPFDVEYTRDMGYAATRLLLSGKSGYLISLENGSTNPIRYEDLPFDDEGRVIPRLVDIESESYQVARKYMFRIDKQDLQDEEFAVRLSETANMTVEQLKVRFSQMFALQAYNPPVF
ncbi:MAG: 6-phosphofructokinase [Planctomycetota bacterium]|jgi:6-phosphofructokinase 1|nr:6-phosphofructokinase [Planctomycetota bacterium]